MQCPAGSAARRDRRKTDAGDSGVPSDAWRDRTSDSPLRRRRPSRNELQQITHDFSQQLRTKKLQRRAIQTWYVGLQRLPLDLRPVRLEALEPHHSRP
jgi:hypothetical protein